jgi:CRISPR-associated protein Cas2
MAGGNEYVAVYDVSGDRERTRVAKVLEGFGQRIQFSAFELRLSAAAHRSLVRRLEALELQSGWVAVYRISARTQRRAIGKVPPNPLSDDRHAWVIGPEEFPSEDRLGHPPDLPVADPENQPE